MGPRSSRCLRLAVVAAALLMCVACGRKTDDEETGATAVPTISAETTTVTRRTLLEAITVRGAVTALPNEDVKVSSLVAGRVTSVTVAEGDSVRQGQVVASIDRRPIEEQRRQASAALEQANAQVENREIMDLPLAGRQPADRPDGRTRFAGHLARPPFFSGDVAVFHCVPHVTLVFPRLPDMT